MKQKKWLFFALITTIFWGVWGALIEIPEKAGFPATLGFAVWSLTMIPCAIIALRYAGWKLETDRRSIIQGSAVGLLGAGGQLILFLALKEGPAYIVFPLISLFPVLTIFLSTLLLKERVSLKHWIGIAAAMIAIFLLSVQPGSGQESKGYGWLWLPVLVFILWGVQAYIMKTANARMKAESIFFYMMITAVAMIPFALLITDFSQPVNWGLNGPFSAFFIQILNAIGALTLVYALRYGKAVIVVPMTGLSPMITVVLSLLLYGVVPTPMLFTGIVLSMAGIYLMAESLVVTSRESGVGGRESGGF